MALAAGLLTASYLLGKKVKNRVHLDLTSQSIEHQAALVAALEARGAARLDVGQDGDEPRIVSRTPASHPHRVVAVVDIHGGTSDCGGQR